MLEMHLTSHEAAVEVSQEVTEARPQTSNAASYSEREQTGGKRRREASPEPIGRFTSRKVTRGFRYLQRFIKFNYRPGPGGVPDFFRMLDELQPVVRKEVDQYYNQHGALTFAFGFRLLSFLHLYCQNCLQLHFQGWVLSLDPTHGLLEYEDLMS